MKEKISKFSIEQLNSWGFLILSSALFVLIIIKANGIPITHDETATTVHYYNFSVWEIMMYPDQWPNNHILNTLISKLFINIGGKHQLVVRLPNVLFFIIYSVGVFRILKTLNCEKSVIFFSGVAFFFANAYLLDFFSLCRGYGISTALVTLSISFLLTGFIRKIRTHLWTAFFLATLASYANFTTLVFWVAISSFCVLFFLFIGNKPKRLNAILKMLFFSILYLALIYTPIKKMTSTNQFEYWTSNGFYNDTIFSLVENWKYGVLLPFGISTKTISIFVLVFFAMNIGFLIRKIQGSKTIYKVLLEPHILLFSLMTLTAFVSIGQSWILDTPNLSRRTALFFFPLFAAWIISVLEKLSPGFDKKIKLTLALIIPSLFWLHFYLAFNPDNVREWWYDENTFEVLEYLEVAHPNLDEVTLAVNWHFHRSFFFYKNTDHVPWLSLQPYNKEIDTDMQAQYYYVMESDLTLLANKYKPIKRMGWDRWLLKKIE